MVTYGAMTEAVLRNPQVGDKFHEMYSFWLYVLAVDDCEVTFISGSELPKDGKIETMQREAFVKRFSYDSMPNKSWLRLSDRRCDVSGWLPEIMPKQSLPKLWDWVGIE